MCVHPCRTAVVQLFLYQRLGQYSFSIFTVVSALAWVDKIILQAINASETPVFFFYRIVGLGLKNPQLLEMPYVIEHCDNHNRQVALGIAS